jgi:non-ribosomal peptide synthetase-like protein
MMPGSTIPDNAGVGVLSRVTHMDELESEVMHMGTPTPRRLYHIPSSFVDRKFSFAEKICYGLSSIIQPFVVILILSFAAFFPCYLATYIQTNSIYYMIAAMPLLYLVYGAALMLSTVILKWLLLGRIADSKKFETYSLYYYRWNLLMMLMSSVHLYFVEIIRGSPFYNFYLTLLGVKVGSNCHLDVAIIPDLDLVSFGDNVVVESNSIICAHSYEEPYITRGSVKVGDGCVVRQITVTLPELTMERNTVLDVLKTGLKGMTLQSYNQVQDELDISAAERSQLN